MFIDIWYSNQNIWIPCLSYWELAIIVSLNHLEEHILENICFKTGSFERPLISHILVCVCLHMSDTLTGGESSRQICGNHRAATVRAVDLIPNKCWASSRYESAGTVIWPKTSPRGLNNLQVINSIISSSIFFSCKYLWITFWLFLLFNLLRQLWILFHWM